MKPAKKQKKKSLAISSYCPPRNIWSDVGMSFILSDVSARSCREYHGHEEKYATPNIIGSRSRHYFIYLFENKK